MQVEKYYFNRDHIIFRHLAKKAIRSYFEIEEFIEFDTPYLIEANTPDPYIDPIWVEKVGVGGASLQLHTSPELGLKQGLSLDFPNIYQIARVFRDDPQDRSHHHEFTMIEWYRQNRALKDL